ncbi:MAG: haloalkane dehalogenase [Deltaproteobacteria bacterium]|nr:haloalkane dehalogenase [Deltaproteobacteria bacterium]
MKILRTPASRFEGLRGFDFARHDVEVAPGLRMAFVEDGPSTASPILMLHGEPTWSYLYRKMISGFARNGHRAIAPDLIGFGRSDKPAHADDYSYASHVAWTQALIERLDLRDITLVCQDWGSLIGLRIVGENPGRFARVVVANGFLPIADRPAPAAFHVWQTFAKYTPILPIGRIVASGCVTQLTREVRAAYDAPFPSREYAVGARVFPALVPTSADDPAVPANRRAWEALGHFSKPFLTLFGKNDPILGRADVPLQRHVPGAAGQPHHRFWGGHFVQEDRGEFLAQTINDWLAGVPTTR